MATDKRLDQVSQLTDFDYALLVKGDQVGKMTKQQVAEAIGNLLYGATTKENLASMVAGVIGNPYGFRGRFNSGQDLNDITERGTYECVGYKCQNTPMEGNYFMLIVEPATSNYIYQRYIYKNAMYVRVRYYDNWDNWRRIDNLE